MDQRIGLCDDIKRVQLTSLSAWFYGIEDVRVTRVPSGRIKVQSCGRLNRPDLFARKLHGIEVIEHPNTVVRASNSDEKPRAVVVERRPQRVGVRCLIAVISIRDSKDLCAICGIVERPAGHRQRGSGRRGVDGQIADLT